MLNTPSMIETNAFSRTLRRRCAAMMTLALLSLSIYAVYSWCQERADLVQELAWRARLASVAGMQGRGAAGPVAQAVTPPAAWPDPASLQAQVSASRIWQNWQRHNTVLFISASLALLACHLLVQLLLRREQQHLQQLSQVALIDGLTGLPSRVAAEQQLQRKVSQAQEYKGSFAVLFMDLDAFKFINDRFGHDRGDEVLRETARRLSACIREHDHLARLGGDEFIAIIACSSKNQVQTAAARLQRALEKPYLVNGQSLPVSLSIGISLYPEDGRTAGELMRQADLAMYAAKRTRRGGYMFYGPEMVQTVQAHFAASGAPDSELASQ